MVKRLEQEVQQHPSTVWLDLHTFAFLVKHLETVTRVDLQDSLNGIKWDVPLTITTIVLWVQL